MQILRISRHEISGALGDIGILLPLAIALITLNGLNPTAVFLSAGLLYIISGLYFRLPIPVQPLKAVAVIALTIGAGPRVVEAAGLLMGVILLFLAISRFCNLLRRIFTKPVVRGIQLGIGLLLTKNGLALILNPRLVPNGEEILISALNLQFPLGIIVAVMGGGIIFCLISSRRFPAALAILVFGLMVGVFFGSLKTLQDISLGPTMMIPGIPSLADFTTAFLFLVLPQIPLTFGNAIVGTSDTARQYFGGKAEQVTPRSLCTSLGIANIAGSLLGGIPMCHGAGGLTAHYRFGARTGKATVFLGALLILLGLLFGGSAANLLAMVPFSILGVMLIYVGIEHAMLIFDLLGKKRELFIALMIGALSMVTGNIFFAFTTGMLLEVLFRHLPGLTLGILGDEKYVNRRE